MGKLHRLFSSFRPSAATGLNDAESSETTELWLVVGLGNPGESFTSTRHNLGFMVIDHMASVRGIELSVRKLEALLAETRFDASHRALLVKPQTFYNETGRSVGTLMRYFKVPLERIIVVHDDLDLEAGRLQVRRGGHHAGNRGVRSLIETLGSDEFVRIRIGIGRPAQGQDPVDYVLERMSETELSQWRAVIERAGAAVESVILEGLQQAMNQFNRRD